jgi:hypothetical protein
MNSDSSARIGGQYFRSPSFSELPFIPERQQQEPYVSNLFDTLDVVVTLSMDIGFE